MYNRHMKKLISEISLILFGNFVLAIAVAIFILPNNILSGGVAGVAILLEPFIDIPKEHLISIINTALFLVGYILLGKHFALTTILSTIAYPFFIMLVPKIFPVVELDPIISSIYAGLIGGIGIGIVVRQGASTGGMDIPPLICQKYFHADLSKCVMVTDGLTVLFGLWIYGLEAVLIGLISVYVTGIAISKALTFGANDAKKIEIISEHNEAISKDIQIEMNRGTTFLKAKGGYTNTEKQVLMVVIADKEYRKLMNIVNRHDSEAFMIVQDAKEVHGEGFSFEPRI